MKVLDLTLPTPAENLACDEALLDWCEETAADDILRFWESPRYFVVLGYANRVDMEVNREACLENNVPILRRCSGGGAVVQGPGCLNYSLVLNFSENAALQTIPQANRFIMERQRDLIQPHFQKVIEVQGHTDLAIGGIKFSGNAQRRKKTRLLFHGTLLLDFDIPLIERVLKMPSKQPDYRANRKHREFLTNLNLSAADVKTALKTGWNSTDSLELLPDLSRLLAEKYSQDAWHFKF